MTECLVHEPAAAEFFREQLGRAMQHQRVSASAFTEFYLVNLLSSCVRTTCAPGRESGFDDVPLALTYARAAQAARTERPRLLRALGDRALFTAGFFGDSLPRRLVDFDYYRTFGGRAYAALSEERAPDSFLPQVFGELGARFDEFAELLAEVSESTRVATQQSIVKLYERWLQTGSRRAARLLAERGLAPVAAADARRH